MTRKLIVSIAATHCANTNGGWGNAWQSSLWAENVGMAAWLLWDEFSPSDQDLILRMIVLEADSKSIDYVVPYYKDTEGNVIYEGDSKAEENAWNSRILALATCMMPDHVHATIWDSKLRELLVSSTARPSDCNRSITIGETLISDVLNGSNINEDGTIINHHRIHVDYMVSPDEGMSEVAVIFALAGRDIPEECAFNQNIIYDALVNLDLGVYNSEKTGSHFYVRAENGEPSYRTDMPEANDWGNNRIANYYLMDTAADVFSYDDSCPVGLKANDWGHARLERMQEMVTDSSSHSIGRFYHDGEITFASEEEFAIQCVAQAFLLRAIVAQ